MYLSSIPQTVSAQVAGRDGWALPSVIWFVAVRSNLACGMAPKTFIFR